MIWRWTAGRDLGGTDGRGERRRRDGAARMVIEEGEEHYGIGAADGWVWVQIWGIGAIIKCERRRNRWICVGRSGWWLRKTEKNTMDLVRLKAVKLLNPTPKVLPFQRIKIISTASTSDQMRPAQFQYLRCFFSLTSYPSIFKFHNHRYF